MTQVSRFPASDAPPKASPATASIAHDARSLVAAVLDRQRRRTDGFVRLGLLPQFDRAMGGLEPGEHLQILGRTESLKTNAATNLIGAFTQQFPGDAFLFVECEMPRAQLGVRFMRQEFRRSEEQLRQAIADGTINLTTFAERYQGLYVVDEGAIALTEVARRGRELVETTGKTLRAIVIDHAGLLVTARRTNAYERASEIGVELKQLARRLNTVVIAIIQASRGAALGARSGEPVGLESARDSGAFEENADFVLAFSSIQRADSGAGTPFVNVRLQKNRRGPHLSARLGFDPVSLRMFELERDDAPSAEGARLW